MLTRICISGLRMTDLERGRARGGSPFAAADTGPRLVEGADLNQAWEQSSPPCSQGICSEGNVEDVRGESRSVDVVVWGKAPATCVPLHHLPDPETSWSPRSSA